MATLYNKIREVALNDKMPEFEFYVIRYDINKRDIEMWNIFNNWLLAGSVFLNCKKYLRYKKDYTLENLREDIREDIMWQECSRVEYEISAGDPFPRDVSELKKVDAYWQALPNLNIITDMCIERTRKFLKEGKKENGFDV